MKITELMVSDDPAQAMQDVKKAAKNPDQYKREQQSKDVDNQKEIQQSTDDPLKNDKLRLAKLKQQVQMQEKRLAQKMKQLEARQGVK